MKLSERNLILSKCVVALRQLLGEYARGCIDLTSSSFWLDLR